MSSVSSFKIITSNLTLGNEGVPTHAFITDSAGTFTLSRNDGLDENFIVQGNIDASYYTGNGSLLEGILTELPQHIGNSATIFVGNGYGISTLNGANIIGNVNGSLLTGTISQAVLPLTLGNSQTMLVGNGALLTNVSATTLANVSTFLTGAISTVSTSNLANSRAVISNASGKLAVAANTSVQDIDFVSGLTGNVETRLQGLTAANIITGAASTASTSNFTPSRVVLTDTQGKFAIGNATTGDLENIRGLRSNVQLQLDAKSGNIVLLPSRAVVTDAEGALTSSATSSSSLEYLEGVTSLIQSQLDIKMSRNVNSWLTSSEGTNRFRFTSGDKTSFGTKNGYEWQGAANTAIMTLGESGDLDVNGAVSTMNHIINYPVAEERYDAEGGAGFKTRLNYIRFNFGRQWCISPEAFDGTISNDNLHFRCGGGAQDLQRLTVTPIGIETLGCRATYGSESIPSYSFFDSTNTGMYCPIVNSLALVTGGVTRLRIDPAGNVGIGTTAPTDRLHVVGNAQIEGLIDIYKSLASTGVYANTVCLNLRVGRGGDDRNRGAMIRFDHDASINRFVEIGSVSEYAGSQYLGLRFNVYNYQLGNYEAMHLNSGGVLSTTGGVRTAGGSETVPSYSVNTDTNTGMWFPGGDTIAMSTGGVEKLRIASDGLTIYEGIVACPNVHVGAIGGGYVSLNRGGYMNTAANANFPYHGIGCSNSGITGIGGYNGVSVYTRSATPGVSLGPGATSWASASDRRLKKDIEPVAPSLEKIKALVPVTYRYLTDDDTLEPKRLGLIAQEVLNVCPELVDLSQTSEDPADNYYMIRYTDVIPLLIKAIQELAAQVDAKEEYGEIVGLDTYGNVTHKYNDARSFMITNTAKNRGLIAVNDGAQAGDYIVPIQGEDGDDSIQAIHIPPATITFEQYRAAIGKVINIQEDGRAFVAVKTL